MIAWVFDVDGVLCDRGAVIQDDFKNWFQEWSKDKSVFLVTGSEKTRTENQIGKDIVESACASFHCLGNSVWVKNKEFRINQFTLTAEEHQWLTEKINSSQFPIKTGNHICIRPGSINFSTVGKNADNDLRKNYAEWDSSFKEREFLVKELSNKFPRLEAFIGGEVSIDICRRGANKGQVVNFIGGYSGVEQIYFFADRLEDFGIDKPFADKITGNEHYKIFNVQGYQNTWEILKNL